jgi:peptide/nickel transport system substrate-binding protein
MLIRSKRLSGLVAIAAASVLVLGACGGKGSGGDKTAQNSPGFAECDAKPTTCNTADTKKGGTMVLALEKTLPNFNNFDSDGNTYDTTQVTAGLVPSSFLYLPDSSVKMNDDLLASAELTSTSPQVVTYKIKPNAVWSDGTPISAQDYEIFWKWQNGKDCPDCTVASTTGYELIDSITGSDNGKTVTVKYKDTYPDWKGLFNGLYPYSVAAKTGGDLTSPAGLTKAYDSFKTETPTWSGNAYLITNYVKDVSVELTPNPKWYGKVKPSLEKIIYKVIEDQAQQAPAMQNKEVQVLTSQPSQDIVTKVQALPNVNYNLAKGPTWEHADINTKNAALADIPLRQAIFTAIDRKAIIDKTIGTFFKGAAPLNNHNIMNGAPGYKDVITSTGQGAGNVDAAKKILTDAGYKIDNGKLINKGGQPVPQIRLRYTVGNTLRQQTTELMQNQLKAIGVDVKIDPTPSLGNTLSTGDYDMIVFAWVGSPFLSGNKDLWATGGGSNYGKWSDPKADALLNEAAKTLDDTKVHDLLNQADEVMAPQAYVLPLYQKPVFLAVYNDYVNIRNNSTLAGPAYNNQEWGLKAS